jgi:hypothetical protein
MNKVLMSIAKEIREALPAMLFFLVAFHMIAITKTAILDEYKVSAASATFATVGALIVGKAILIVEKLPLARFFSVRVISNILWKTLLFGLVAMLFRILEELIPLLGKHQGFVAAVEHLSEDVSWSHFWVVQMWLFSLLFLYCLAAEFVRMVGPGKVRTLLFAPRDGTSDS